MPTDKGILLFHDRSDEIQRAALLVDVRNYPLIVNRPYRAFSCK